jgi:rod shape-determining protein MreC
LLVLASISIITLDYRGDAHGEIASLKSGASDAFSPVQRAVDAVTHPIGSFLAGAFDGGELEQENNRLRLANSRLEQQVLSGQARADALQALQKLENLPWASGIAVVTAQVINRSPSNFAATIELDKGTTDGVDAGMPVVGSGGLVGQVTATSSRTCTVQLITDASTDAQGVGVTFGSSAGNEAIVQGRGIGKPLSVNYIPPGPALRKGEVLTTSGDPDLAYPPGIPVARISRYSSTASASQVTVTAVPVATIGQLAYVDILQWQPAS